MFCLGLSTAQGADIPEKEHLGRKYDMKETFLVKKRKLHLPPSLRANLRCQRRDANNTMVKISSPSLVSIDQWCSNLRCPLESSGSLKNFQMPGPPYREPHLICLG